MLFAAALVSSFVLETERFFMRSSRTATVLAASLPEAAGTELITSAAGIFAVDFELFELMMEVLGGISSGGGLLEERRGTSVS